MYDIFDRILAQSLGGSYQAPVSPQYGTDTMEAVRAIRNSGKEKKPTKETPKDATVTDIYKNRMITQAARGEGPWAQSFNTGGVYGDLPTGLNQNDAMNYQIQRRAYLEAKEVADHDASKQADRDWKNHMDEKYGMLGSIPGEGN